MRLKLYHTIILAESRVMLSPSGDVSVCPKSQVLFRCSTNSTFLEWIITISQSGRLRSKRQVITAKTGSLIDLDLIISEHVFNITKTSAYNSYPLESVLTIADATALLSATEINYTESELN